MEQFKVKKRRSRSNKATVNSNNVISTPEHIKKRWKDIADDCERVKMQFHLHSQALHNKVEKENIKALNDMSEQDRNAFYELKLRARREQQAIIQARSLVRKHQDFVNQLNGDSEYYAIHGFVPSVQLYSNFYS